MYIAWPMFRAYNLAGVCKYLFNRAMKLISRMFTPARLLILGVLSATSFGTQADTLPQTERVTMRATETLPVVDRVVVRKAERKLFLLHGGTVVRTYKVALGLNPIGTKERSGDFRTPEGAYRLVRRNPRSEYFLSMQVSYPNDSDLKHARRNHWDTGGSIMIHGLPNQLKHDPSYYESRDWTDGCIAVSNSDMLEIWLLTPDNAPIEILP
jgi:murein L,D-transpeptidase YafK